MEHIENDGNRVKVHWRGEASDDAEPGLRFQVRYSHNGGTTWRGIAAGLDNDNHTVELKLLPGGTDCLIEINASAGLRSATAVTDVFEVPRKRRQAHIVLPRTGAKFEEGAIVPLAGGGFSPDFGTAPSNDTVWTSSVLGVLGVGERVSLSGLPVGHNYVTLRVPDGMGGEASATIAISVLRPRRHEEEFDPD